MVKIEVRKAEKIKSEKQSMFVTFDYRQEFVDAVKSLACRYFNPSSREWEVPLSKINELVKKLGEHTEIKILAKAFTENVALDAVSVAKAEAVKTELPADFTFKTTPFQHQVEGLAYGLANNKWLLGDEQGLGKAVTLGTKVLTPTGWVTMLEISAGDLVIGKNGKPTKVLATHDHESKHIYRVTFSDNTEIECCNEHLWAVKTGNDFSRCPENFYRVLSLAEIKKDYLLKYNYKYYLPMVSPVEFTEKELSVDPYVLGCLLGNGSLGNNNVGFTSADIEIVAEVNKRLLPDYFLSSSPSMNDNEFNLSKRETKSSKKNNIKEEIKRMGLNVGSHQKFIPDKYKYNNVENRLALLQGLMDTDGYADSDGGLQYYTTSERLADDVSELVQSFGGVARKSSSVGSYKKNGEIVKCKNCFTLTINVPLGMSLFKLPRKLLRCKASQKYSPIRMFKKIEYMGEMPAKCITVEAEDGMYVIENYVVTHNTKQIIDLAVAKKAKIKHCLIIAGVNGLKHNWAAEIKTHSNETGKILGSKLNKKLQVVDGTLPERKADIARRNHGELFLIINVESLRSAEVVAEIVKACKEGYIGMVAFDEIHSCRNPQAKQSKGLMKISAPNLVAMTGTLVMNKPLDVYNTLKWLGAESASYFQFRNRYCVMGGYGGYEIIGYKNMTELREKVDRIMLRRLKKDVLDLPAKIRKVEYVEMGAKQLQLYNEVMASIKDNLPEISLDPNPLSRLIRLRQVTGAPSIISPTITESAKLDRLVEIVEELRENGQKVVIFSNWSEMAKAAVKVLKSFRPELITGDVPAQDRKAIVDKFQTDATPAILVGTIGAMGTGLTLTASSTVIFLDLPWTAAALEQAEDRCHRIGTTQSVSIIYLVAKDTIDERIIEVVGGKKNLADALVDGQMEKLSSRNMLHFLLG